MQIWGLTDPGNIRQQNQDTYEIVSFGHDRALMIVCDGMGGAKSGNIASSMAAETFVAEVRRCQKLATGTERVISILKGALELANQAVYEHSGLSDDYSGISRTRSFISCSCVSSDAAMTCRRISRELIELCRASAHAPAHRLMLSASSAASSQIRKLLSLL